MPYSRAGACEEHITNVSDNEIPGLVTTIEEWLETVPNETLNRFGIDQSRFSEYHVLPRLLFGQYLEAQFRLLIEMAKAAGIAVHTRLNSCVEDIQYKLGENEVWVRIEGRQDVFKFDKAVISTGHSWPKKHEGAVPRYFDSPYPPDKLALHCNHPVAIRGASLTAIDAIRTLARSNGKFIENKSGQMAFELASESPAFRLVLHSRGGLLPAVRFHLEDTHLSKYNSLSEEEVKANRAENEGFLSLDYVFEKYFIDTLRDKDPAFYDTVRDMRLEDFVEAMMKFREHMDPFELMKLEYREAEQSIQDEESVHWKEMLASLSFAMNYPAKYFSAEDMLRLQKVLKPLISIVIAFVPQSSCRELLALHAAGVLSLISVDEDSEVVPEDDGGCTYRYTDEASQPQSARYHTYVDCVGQPALPYRAFPFPSLIDAHTITPARLRFRSDEEGHKALAGGDSEHVEHPADGHYYLKVPGIAINDCFQVVDAYGAANPGLFIMAVPFIGGFNPDYSGLDFCEAASERIVGAMVV